MEGPSPSIDWIAFGPFVLHLKQRVLTWGGNPCELNPRSLELLIALLERPGEVQTKDELLERIWQDRIVDEVNLRVAVTALRRCLALAETTEHYVLNSVGRGYSFSGKVQLEYWPPRPAAPPLGQAVTAVALQGQLPLLLKRVIGREGVAEKITEILDQNRLVTVVGAAGIGKTTIAIRTASNPSNLTEEVRFVDFAPGRDPALVLARIAASMTLDQISGDPLQVIIKTVANKRMLIVLDNCEHVLDAVAEAASAILQNAPRVNILATSREPLRVVGEVVYRLEGLAYPEEAFAGNFHDALDYSAVRLLVECVQAASPAFILEDSLASATAEICRRLDGIALAIQLAAGLVATLGPAEVAARLDDRFRFLGRGARTTLARHQTLDAAISWSFELLNENERLTCVRLSIFSGEFSIDAAIDVAGWAPIPSHEAAIILASLVEKSLIVFVSDPARPRYVFLETIRDFARARLRILDRDHALLRKLAQRLISDCDRFMELSRRGDAAEATAFARRRLDDLRYTIGRAFEIGDTALQSALLVKFAPLMFHLGVIFEFTDWLRRSLDAVTSADQRLPLLMPYARALSLSRPNLPMQISLYEEAVEIARSLDDHDSELRARWGLCYSSSEKYSAQKCLEAASAFQDRARELDDRSAVFVAESLKGRALHDLGEFLDAMKVHRHVVDHYPAELSAADANRFGLNHRAISMCDLSEVYWQIGALGEAEDWNQAAIREAGDHLPTLFTPSSQHLCRAIWEGSDWDEVACRFDALTRRFNVDGRWKNWISNLGAIIEIQRNGTQAAFANLDADILHGRWQALNDRYVWIVVHFIQCCMTLDKADFARKLADQLVPELKVRKTHWMLPEALRLKALTLADVDCQAAAACFEEARDAAVTIGATTFARYIEASFDASGCRPAPQA